jgi:hypothetical protein
MFPMFPLIFPTIVHYSSIFLDRWFSGGNPAEIIGSLVGGVFFAGAGFLLLKQAITGDEGFKTVKQIALLSLIPASLVGLAQVINLSGIQVALTNFFIVIRRLLGVWDFWLDVPLLLSLMLTVFTILSAYWGYLAYMFVVRFFNER